MDERRYSIFQIGKNILATGIAYVIPPILVVITTPLFVYRLGLELYGTWLILQTIEDIAGITEFGLTSTIIKYGAEFYVRGETKDLNRLIRMYMSYGTLAGIAVSLAILLMGNIVTVVFKFPAIEENVLSLLIGMTCANILVQTIALVPRAVVIAMHRIDWVSTLELGLRMSGLALAAILLSLGWTIVFVVASDVILNVVRMLLFFFLARYLDGRLSFRPGFDGGMASRIASFNIYNAALSIVGRINSVGDRFFVGLFWGPQGSSLYTVADKLGIQVNAIVSQLLSFLLPLSSSLRAMKQDKRLGDIFHLVSKLTILGAFSLGIPMIIGAYQIMDKWLGPTFMMASAAILQLQVASYVLGAILKPGQNVLNGLGRVRPLSVWMTMSTALVVLLYLFMIPQYGLIGASYANITRAIINLMIYFFIFFPMVAKNAGRDLYHSLVPPVVGTVVCAGIEYGFRFLSSPQSLFVILVTLAAYGFLIFGVGILTDVLLDRSNSIWSVVKGELAMRSLPTDV